MYDTNHPNWITMKGTWKPMMHMTVENVTYAIGSVFIGRVVNVVICTHCRVRTYLHTSFEHAQNLDVVFGYDLCEANEYSDLQCHLAMILVPVAVIALSIDGGFLMEDTYRNTGFANNANSNQFTTTAMILETTIVTATNLAVSTAPHSRSR